MSDLQGNYAESALRRVLVATDFSEGAAVAVRRAFELAAPHGAHVTVVHVAPRGVAAEIMNTAEDGLRQLVWDAPVPADTLLTTGAPSARIAAEAERSEADLVVVGAHGAHWLRDVFIGSTAEMVVAASEVPVLLVKGPADAGYSTVLLAVEATRQSFQAARFGLALTPTARHVLAHAVTVLGENLLRLNGADDRGIDELRRGQLDLVRPHIERLARELTPAPAEVTVEPARPEVLVSTLAGSCEAEMLVVGTERGAGIRRALLGSVSRHAMQRAPCDVLVVPLEPAAARADISGMLRGQQDMRS